MIDGAHDLHAVLLQLRMRCFECHEIVHLRCDMIESETTRLRLARGRDIQSICIKVDM
jgi:hypothetical protein